MEGKGDGSLKSFFPAALKCLDACPSLQLKSAPNYQEVRSPVTPCTCRPISVPLCHPWLNCHDLENLSVPCVCEQILKMGKESISVAQVHARPSHPELHCQPPNSNPGGNWCASQNRT